jgi:hypothetical protein
MIGTNVIEHRHFHPHRETPRKNSDATLTMKQSATDVADTADVDAVDNCG